MAMSMAMVVLEMCGSYERRRAGEWRSSIRAIVLSL
jgi:hypothetical protein